MVELKERSAEMGPPAVLGVGLVSGVNGFGSAVVDSRLLWASFTLSAEL